MSNDEGEGSNVDTRLLDSRIKAEFDRRLSGSGGGGGGGLDSRIGKLEEGFNDLKIGLARIEAKLEHLAKATDLAELKGRVSQLPTIWQLFGIIVAVFGFAFALIRLGLPHN